MPKRKQTFEPRFETRSRRAASKVALEQMHKLTNKAVPDAETLEILSDDEEAPLIETPPQKKYRLSHRKSADGNDRDVIVLKTVKYEENTLKLDCWPEDLSPAQLSIQNKMTKEWTQLNKQLDTLLKDTSSRSLLYEGDSFVLYDLQNQPEPTTFPSRRTAEPAQSSKNNGATPAVKLVMDPKSGVVLGTMTPTMLSSVGTSLQSNKGANKKSSNSTTVQPPAKVIKLTADAGKSSDSSNSKSKIVDLTSDESNKSKVADSREVTFNKLQGKTFPSLVVVARPLLNVVDFNSNRSNLDAKVKGVLMYQPTKFTEWLIQQGLVRSEQNCTNHPFNKLKLGIYSDSTKFTISGGYVWVTDCCPSRFVSVFKGSIFEGSPHSSVVILKLIYHWACQTLVQNVVQWVRVENLYIKGMNTWLRSVCTVALHNHLPKLGGPGVKVEIGVISLGTTSHDGNQRQVKVEVLGILESSTRRLRLRAVEPLLDGDRNYKKRFFKILEPLNQWVHPESYIISDLTVDKSTLLSMGFMFVHQTTATDPACSNNTVMEYLRKVVPRMFQNTLSLLSRQIIQQFLDELVWREWYGTTAASAFDNIIAHIAEQTRVDYGMSLILRLNKVAVNPFKDWNYKSDKSVTPVATFKTPTSSSHAVTISANKKQYGKKPKPDVKIFEIKSKYNMEIEAPTDKQIPLENYYYGSINGGPASNERFLQEIRCTLCKKSCKNNVELMDHLFSHATSSNSFVRQYQCRYCLTCFKQAETLNSHITNIHPVETKTAFAFACLICYHKAKSSITLGKHMANVHVPSELPYMCQICSFRCSYHRDVVNHFYSKHTGGSLLQCPFCLKTESMVKQKRVPYISSYLQHVMKHLKKGLFKKCPKCALTFITKEELKEHSAQMHLSMKNKHGLIKRVVKQACMVPLAKLPPITDDEEEEDDDTIDLKNLVIEGAGNLKCIECSGNMSTSHHFPSLQFCSHNCQFVTCCKKAMTNHKCNSSNAQLPLSPLPFQMYCVCGYAGIDGNVMAKHLAVCERNSAYPSVESAASATVTHSMLDVLGLVRKAEEPTPTVIEMDTDDELSLTDKAERNSKKRKRSNEEKNESDKNSELGSDDVIEINDNENTEDEDLINTNAKDEDVINTNTEDDDVINTNTKDDDVINTNTKDEDVINTNAKDEDADNENTTKIEEPSTKTTEDESATTIDDSNTTNSENTADTKLIDSVSEDANVTVSEEVSEDKNIPVSENANEDVNTTLSEDANVTIIEETDTNEALSEEANMTIPEETVSEKANPLEDGTACDDTNTGEDMFTSINEDSLLDKNDDIDKDNMQIDASSSKETESILNDNDAAEIVESEIETLLNEKVIEENETAIEQLANIDSDEILNAKNDAKSDNEDKNEAIDNDIVKPSILEGMEVDEDDINETLKDLEKDESLLLEDEQMVDEDALLQDSEENETMAE